MRYGRRGSADPVSADDQEAVTSVTFSGPRPMEQSIPQGALRDLVGAARAGDGAATDQLMAGVHQLAVRYARARLGTLPGAREAAQDVAQEVCVAVLTSLSRYTDRGLPFEAFVYRIAANKVAGVRAALCTDAATAEGARRWNDANVLAIGLRLTSEDVAAEMLDAFLSAEPDADELATIARVER